MKKITTGMLPATLLALTAGTLGPSGPADAATFTEALTGGKPAVDVRLRYENVDQDNATDEADALTVRTRLGYGTAGYKNFSGYVEMENTSALEEDYNSGPGGNGKTKYSVVADPEITEVNQAFLAFSGLPDSEIKAGRQRIILDNARFVGNVGWRQAEQTYDALKLSNTSLPNTTLNYAYLTNSKDILSADIDLGNTHLINASFKGLGFGTLTGYGYLVEFDDAPANSSQTLGISFDGATDVGSITILYRAELAQQSDYEDGNKDIDGDYRHFILGVSSGAITAKAGYELLGADDFSGFETPLATKHAFNGWADVFLNTPTDGLVDGYVLVAGVVKGVQISAVYHDFQADKGSLDYGTEIDLLASKKFGEHYSGGVKYASYDADDFSVDTDKLWIWGQAQF